MRKTRDSLPFKIGLAPEEASRNQALGAEALEMAASIGEQLRQARQERGIPLREISDQTRISIRYLEAIEANDYKRLPGGIYTRGFVRAYARCIGYDEKEAMEGYTRYLREQGESADDVVTTPLHSKVYTDTPATRSPVLTVILTILILAILTLLALAALHWYQRRSAKLNTESETVVMVNARNPVLEKELWIRSDLISIRLPKYTALS